MKQQFEKLNSLRAFAIGLVASVTVDHELKLNSFDYSAVDYGVELVLSTDEGQLTIWLSVDQGTKFCKVELQSATKEVETYSSKSMLQVKTFLQNVCEHWTKEIQ